ncbi:MAG: glycosyltransferase, partial [Brevinematia bacterium]
MKICLLAPANSVHTLKIAYSLKESNNDVFIISFHKPRVKDLEILYIPPIMSPLGKLNYLLHIPKIKKILEQSHPDILHAHYVSSYGFVGSLLNYHPFIVSVWGSDIFNFPKKSFL